MRKVRSIILSLSMAGILATPSLNAQQPPPSPQQAFATMLAKEYGFSPQEVTQQLAKANKNDDILAAIARPWEAKPWFKYRPIFLTDKRLNKGLEFWQTHQRTLQRAEQKFAIPPEIIVAIIGVETFYGHYTGTYSALDALYTLGFYYPPRSTFFRKELAELFLLSREEQFSISELSSSYAGALGWGQFIPSSYRHYGVDFDDDGIKDLLNNPVDAIGSVANYFHRHGWQKDQPVAFPVKVEGSQYREFVGKGLKYEHNLGQLKEAGIKLDESALSQFAIQQGPKSWQQVDATSPVRLFEFEQENQDEYWLGLKNFYVITRYNHSPLYAMAVYQFSLQLKHAWQAQTHDPALSPEVAPTR